jgi:hypothetical protein
LTKRRLLLRKLSPKLQPWLDEFNKQAAALLAAGFKPTPSNGREYLDNLTRALVTEWKICSRKSAGKPIRPLANFSINDLR